MGLEQLKGLKKYGYPAEKRGFVMQNLSMAYCIRMGKDKEDEYSVQARRWLDSIEGVPRDFTWKRKILLTVYRIHPALFDLICIVFRRRLKK